MESALSIFNFNYISSEIILQFTQKFLKKTPATLSFTA